MGRGESRVKARTKVGKSRARGRGGPPSAGAGGRAQPAPPGPRCRGVAGPSRPRPPGSPSSAEVPRGAGGAGRAWGRGGAGGDSGPPARAEPPAVAFVSGSGQTKPPPACFPVRVPFSDPLPPPPPGPSEAGGETRSFKSRCGPYPRRLRKWRGPRTWPVPLPPPPPRGSCARARAAQRGGGAVPCVAGPRREGRGRVPARLRRGDPAEQEAGCWTVRPYYSGPGGRRHEDGVDRTLPKGQAVLAHRILCDVSKPPLCASASRSV